MSVGSCSSTREVMMSGDVWQQEWMLRWMVAWRSQMGLNMGIMTAAVAATLSTVIQHLWSNRESPPAWTPCESSLTSTVSQQSGPIGINNSR